MNLLLRYQETCGKNQIKVKANVAWTKWTVFDVTNNSMTKFSPIPVLHKSSTTISFTLPYDWEILDSFFQEQNIIPNWIDTNGMVGIVNKTTGKWIGAVGKVSKIIMSSRVCGSQICGPFRPCLGYM